MAARRVRACQCMRPPQATSFYIFGGWAIIAYRELAGLHDRVPGQGDLCHFRYRVGDDVIHKTMAVVVEFLHTFGLIKGELLSTDGQLDPSYSRYKGCTYACEGCHAFQVDEAGRQALRCQFHSGAKRLELT